MERDTSHTGPIAAPTVDSVALTAPAVVRPTAPGALPSPTSEPGGDGERVMSLVDHLAELRRRLLISALAVAAGTVVGFLLAPHIIRLLLQPIPGGRVEFLTPGGGFFIHLKVALVVGIGLALPVVLYQLWAFVAPGLTPEERRAARPWLPLAIVFFLLGVSVAYFTLPYALTFLLSFQIADALVARPTAEAYFGFITTIFLAFGVVMQFPIVLVLLSKLGILTVERLRASRRYVFLAVYVFAVVATPGGDIVSPLVMGTVLYVLYEGTIWMLRRGDGAASAEGGR